MPALEFKNNEGFSALVLVLIIGISSMIVAKSTTWLSLREMDMSLDSNMSKLVVYANEACEEDALYHYNLDSNYQADDKTIQLDECTCNYSTVDNGNEKIVNISSVCTYYQLDTQIIIDTIAKPIIRSRNFN